jgi:hypothetical protein
LAYAPRYPAHCGGNATESWRNRHIAFRESNEKPGRVAGFLSLPERSCLASILVFGDDWSRKQVEVIVQAGADDIAPKACPREGSAVGKERPCGIEILQRGEAV